MKTNLKRLIVCFLLTLAALSCAFLASCNLSGGKNGTDGKDGTDGADGENAVITVTDDGFLSINGEKTNYYLSKKDCSVKIKVENEKFGAAYGSGSYAYGKAVLLTAEPAANGVFVEWKDSLGKTLGKDENLLHVTDNGETEITAFFACSPAAVTAKINVRFDGATLPSASYVGETEAPLLGGANLKFEDYGENALILYAVDKQTFEKSDEEINEIISSGEFGSGERITYEKHIGLFDKSAVYPDETAEFYYYVAGKPNARYSVNVSSSDQSGNVTVSGGDKLSGEKGYLAGTVLKLNAKPKTEKINGITYEASDFLGWTVGDKIISTEREIAYEVTESAEITAKFAPKTKLSLTLKSGEDGLTSYRYPDSKEPSKAEGSINGKSFEANIVFDSGVAKIDLGYFTLGEFFSLELRVYAEPNYNTTADWNPFRFENSWRYIRLIYEYDGGKIGEGNSLTFFVLGGSDNRAEISVKYIRTGNFYTSATNEKGENAKERMSGSGYGLVD